ncbi:hypothetical protein HPB47_010874 [Ixodes persulcatus]|uniref:Uncharacterized protein n=1 Tax=Ixodes persulcatus TaxID=34615 RepID=A0AC60NY36_IXOPE|nr:hypothetical protein HPB47_010874 [Ixodes persulcatus]
MASDIMNQHGHRTCENGREHLWVHGKIGNVLTAVCILHLSVGNNRQEENNNILECVRRDMHNLHTGLSVLIMEDLNGHLVELDGREDNNGRMMRRLAEDLELEILNLREDCEGQHTWIVRDRRTCIDYELASKRLGTNRQTVVVDEEGEWSVNSDHKIIFLHFDTVRGTPSRS